MKTTEFTEVSICNNCNEPTYENVTIELTMCDNCGLAEGNTRQAFLCDICDAICEDEYCEDCEERKFDRGMSNRYSRWGQSK